MPPERWQQVDQLYHAALEDRAVLDTADPELRREVESLLAHDGPALDRPAWEAAADQLDDTQTQLTPGAQLGPYRIEAALGAGGMGRVYRALDIKLSRPVAVKLLADDLVDPAARRRFQREAQMASALNHPHILTVHDAGDFEGRQYLVTEFVDGGTLKDWAKRDKRTWREIVELLVGIADGMATAHDAGILHRDIKPANILVTKSGYAKLADFGLAKLVEPADSDITSTLTEGRTRPGMVLGTIAYMSPDQASGQKLDARSDIFSFGVVLYELLSGQRPFTGSTDLELLQNIIHGAPQPLGGEIPEALRAAVEKALAKDRGERYQSMHDMVVDLRRLVRLSGEESVARPARVRRPWAAAAAALVLVGGAALWKFAPNRGPSQIRSIAVLPLDNFSRDPEQEFFADGMTEQLITDLSKIGSLRITSRTSVMRYKEKRKPLPEIARELNVDVVIEGSVLRVGDRVRITALAALQRHGDRTDVAGNSVRADHQGDKATGNTGGNIERDLVDAGTAAGAAGIVHHGGLVADEDFRAAQIADERFGALVTGDRAQAGAPGDQGFTRIRGKGWADDLVVRGGDGSRAGAALVERIDADRGWGDRDGHRGAGAAVIRDGQDAGADGRS